MPSYHRHKSFIELASLIERLDAGDQGYHGNGVHVPL